MWLPLTYPLLGIWSATQACALDWELKWRPFSSQARAQSTDLHQPGHLLSYLFIFKWAHEYLFYSIDYNPMLLPLLCCSHYSFLGHWVLSWVSSCVIATCPHSFFSTFLLSGTTKHYRFLLCISCSSHRNTYFSKKLWLFFFFFLLKNAN